MNIRSALLVSVDNDLVDQFDQFVVRSRRYNVFAAADFTFRILVQRAQQIVDIARVFESGRTTEHRIQRAGKFLVGGDTKNNLALRVDVVDHPRRLDALRVGGDNDNAFLDLLQRHPLIGLTELAIHVLHQVGRLDAVLLEWLVRHAEVAAQRIPQRRQLDLEFVGQHGLDIQILAARGTLRQFEFLARDDCVGDQRVVFAAHLHHRALALAEGNRQRLGQRNHAIFHHRRERLPGLVVDDLHDADQFLGLGFEHRRHQHLLGAITGFCIDRFQKIQLCAVGFELNIVVNVADVDDPLVGRHKTRDRLLVDRQLDVLERVQPRLHLRDDRALVLAEQVDRQSVGVEQVAQLLRQLQDDLVDVFRRMNLVGHRLQLLLKTQLFSQIVGSDRFALEYCAHDYLTVPTAAVTAGAKRRAGLRIQIAGSAEAYAPGVAAPGL